MVGPLQGGPEPEAAPFRNDAEFPVVENNEISAKYKNEDGVRNDDNFVPGAAAEWLPCLAPAELPVYRRGDVVGCATRDRVAECIEGTSGPSAIPSGTPTSALFGLRAGAWRPIAEPTTVSPVPAPSPSPTPRPTATPIMCAPRLAPADGTHAARHNSIEVTIDYEGVSSSSSGTGDLSPCSVADASLAEFRYLVGPEAKARNPKRNLDPVYNPEAKPQLTAAACGGVSACPFKVRAFGLDPTWGRSDVVEATYLVELELPDVSFFLPSGATGVSSLEVTLLMSGDSDSGGAAAEGQIAGTEATWIRWTTSYDYDEDFGWDEDAVAKSGAPRDGYGGEAAPPGSIITLTTADALLDDAAAARASAANGRRRRCAQQAHCGGSRCRSALQPRGGLGARCAFLLLEPLASATYGLCQQTPTPLWTPDYPEPQERGASVRDVRE